MKIDKLEAHDRYEDFTAKDKDQDIGECCQDLINKRPFGSYPFYIFAHTRTDEDGVTKRLIWQPRLTKPKAQTNSMLFKAYPGSDVVKVMWMIPEREMWKQYSAENICNSAIVRESIYAFQYARHQLEEKEKDDLNDWEINSIYTSISQQAKKDKAKLMIEEALSSSSSASPSASLSPVV